LLWSLGRLGVRVAACSACRSETYACEGSSSATYLIDHDWASLKVHKPACRPIRTEFYI